MKNYNWFYKCTTCIVNDLDLSCNLTLFQKFWYDPLPLYLCLTIRKTIRPQCKNSLDDSSISSFFPLCKQYSVNNEEVSLQWQGKLHPVIESASRKPHLYFGLFQTSKDDEMKTNWEFCLLTEPWDGSLTWAMRAYIRLACQNRQLQILFSSGSFIWLACKLTFSSPGEK